MNMTPAGLVKETKASPVRHFLFLAFDEKRGAKGYKCAVCGALIITKAGDFPWERHKKCRRGAATRLLEAHATTA